MSFQGARAYLDALGVDAMKGLRPTLHRMEAICEALNHPERAVPAVHITGTNGKTSTARMVASLLDATGLAVGTYTSPHLESVTERIALSGEPLTEDAFGELFEHTLPYVQLVEKNLGERLSYFEILTAMFFLWAAEQPVDAAVVEVGLGGTWDATNVVASTVSVVTNVGLDHTGLLGSTTDEIALEKAGIIKDGSVVVTAERAPNVLAVLADAAAEHAAELAALDKAFSIEDNRIAVGGRFVTVSTSARHYEGLFVPLHGSHQGVNAATALEAITRFLPARELDTEVVADGFAATVVPGRLETVRPDGEAGATVVLDVAHNPDGVSALASSLIEAFAFERVVFVLGVLHDKDYEGMVAELGRVPCTIVTTQASSMRSVPPDDLKGAAERRGLDAEIVVDVADAIERASSLAGATDLVCVTGSHYVVGDARAYLLRR